MYDIQTQFVFEVQQNNKANQLIIIHQISLFLLNNGY